MSRVPQVGGFDILPLIYIALIAALMFAPMFLGRRPAPPASDEPGSDDGPGRGPKPPPDGSNSPTGGLPLLDAEQSRTRRREHGRATLRLPGPRREREHERPPAPTPTQQ
jgi:hypothetical protein